MARGYDDDDDEQQDEQQYARAGDQDDDDDDDDNTQRRAPKHAQARNDDDDDEDGQGAAAAADDDDDEGGAATAAADDDDDEGAGQGEVEEAEGNDAGGGDVTEVNDLNAAQIQAIAELVTQGLVAHMHNAHEDDEDEHLHPSQIHTDTREPPDDDEEKNFIITLTTSTPDGKAHSIKGKVDTGASDNFMVEDVAHVLGLRVERAHASDNYTTGSGTSVEPVGIARLGYTIKGKHYVEDFRVMAEDLPHDVILGGPFLLHSHLISLNLPKDPPKGKKGFFLFEKGPNKMSKKDLDAARDRRNAEREAASQAHSLAGRGHK